MRAFHGSVLFFWRDVALRAGASFSSGVRQSGGRGGTKPRRGGGIPGAGSRHRSQREVQRVVRPSSSQVGGAGLPPPSPDTRAFPPKLALKNTARHSKARQHNLETTWRDCAVSRVRDSLHSLARDRPRVLSVLPQNAQKHHKSHNNGAQGHEGPRRRVLPLLATARAGFVHPLAITLARHSTHSRPCAQRALCNTRVLCQPSREIGQRRVARRVRVRRG